MIRTKVRENALIAARPQRLADIPAMSDEGHMKRATQVEWNSTL